MMRQGRFPFGDNPLALLRLASALIGLGLILYSLLQAIPPTEVVIEVGPPGGSYEQTALAYREALTRHGIDLRLHYNPDSLGIVEDVEARRGGAMLGFIAEKIPAGRAPHVESLGAIEMQPLFIVYSLRIGELATPNALRGRRIALPPERSATGQAALRLLAHYGIDPSNTDFVFMPLLDAVEGLLARRYDVGIFMLGADNPNILRLMRDPNLVLLDSPDATALSRLQFDLRPTRLPRRIYDFRGNYPPRDIELLGAPINVIVNKGLHAGIIYALLEVMSEQHREPSFVAGRGEFPNIVDTLMPVSSIAKNYYKSGTPWLYREFSIYFAGTVDYYLIVGILIFFSTEIYKTLKYLTELIAFVVDLAVFSLLTRLDRASHGGQPLRPWQLRLLVLSERALSRTSHRKRGEILVSRIRARHESAKGSG
jgi:uncharacterized protein